MKNTIRHQNVSKTGLRTGNMHNYFFPYTVGSLLYILFVAVIFQSDKEVLWK